MGIGLVRRVRTLHLVQQSESRRDQLSELITALECQAAHVEGLVRFELQLELQRKDPNLNVVALPNARTKIPRKPIFQRVFDRRYAINIPCLITGQNSEERRKVALEIHSRTERPAFLDFRSDLLEVLDCTLFISEVNALTALEQDRILNALKNPSAPLLISATQFSLAQLKEMPNLNPELIQRLSPAHFRLQYPLQHYLRHGFFKLFLESLA